MELCGWAYSRCQWDLCSLWLVFGRWCVCETKCDWLIGILVDAWFIFVCIFRAMWSWETTPSLRTSRWSRRPRASHSAAKCWPWTSRRSRLTAPGMRWVTHTYCKCRSACIPPRPAGVPTVPPFTHRIARRSTWAQGSSKCLKWSAQKNKAEECWWTTINKSSLYTK